MVLERSVRLLQQEEKIFGPDKGIHESQWKQKTLGKNGNKVEGRHGGYWLGRSFCHESQGSMETRIHKTNDFNITQGAKARKTRRKTIKDLKKTLTDWTGAYKDRTIQLNDETHLDHMNTIRQGKLGHREHMGRKTHTKPVHNPDKELVDIFCHLCGTVI